MKRKAKPIQQLASQNNFTLEEAQRIKSRFEMFALWGKMALSEFRKSMGLLGTSEAEFLCDQIFKLIAPKGSQHIEFQDFLRFLSVLMKGSPKEKGQISFRLLDQDEKGFINYKDIETTIFKVCHLWSYLTGEKVVPKRPFIEYVCDHLRIENSETKISLETYLIHFNDSNLFNWFQLFNEPQKEAKKVQLPLTLVSSSLENISHSLSSAITNLKLAQQSDCSSTANSHLWGPLHFDSKSYPVYGDLQEEQLTLTSSENSFMQKQDESELQSLKGCLESSIGQLQELVSGEYFRGKQEQWQRASLISNRHSASKNTIYIGHQNWNLILNMMIGIRKVTKSLFLTAIPEVFDKAQFSKKSVFELINQRTQDFDPGIASLFYEYAPLVFYHIRRMSGISTSEYLRSIGPQNLVGNLILGNLSSLNQQTSCGKSGSFFYYTEDAKLMIKTITKDQFELLKQILSEYHRHLKHNPRSLICRIYGLYKMKIHDRKLYIIAMANLFNLPFEIDLRYDLKGSTYSRTSKTEHWEKTIALKDLDLLNQPFDFDLCLQDKKLLSYQLELDVQFFKDQNIIDYSLLIGVLIGKYKSLQSNPFVCKSQSGDKTYCLGLIDILTEYGTRKVLEKGVKQLFLGKGVSCTDPEDYGERFLRFVREHFLQL